MQWHEVEDDDALADASGNYLLRRCLGHPGFYWLLSNGALLSTERLTLEDAEQLIAKRPPVPQRIHDCLYYDVDDTEAAGRIMEHAVARAGDWQRYDLSGVVGPLRLTSNTPSAINIPRDIPLQETTMPFTSGAISTPCGANPTDELELAPLTDDSPDEEISENSAQTTGQSEILSNNESSDVSGGVAENNVTQTQERKMLTIEETQARNMLTACGLKSARETSVAKLTDQLNSLVSYQDDLNIPEDPVLKRWYKRCLEARKDNVDIVIGDPDANGNGHAHDDEGGGTAVLTKKKTAKKKTAVATAPRATSVPRASGSGQARKKMVETGEVLIRKYKGEDHKVKALASGDFRYNGEDFTSLTNVAKKITGYPSISGPVFFGLTKLKK